MEIYQGEPLGAKINIKNDDGTYVTDLSSYSLEAILHSDWGIAASWSTAKGSISIGTETVQGVTRGYAAFSMSGEVSASLQFGDYTLEVANVLGNGRAIGVAKDVVTIKEADIRKGI